MKLHVLNEHQVITYMYLYMYVPVCILNNKYETAEQFLLYIYTNQQATSQNLQDLVDQGFLN